MSSWVTALWQHLKQHFVNLSAQNKQRGKYFAFFSIGCLSFNLIAYHTASRLTGLNYLQLFAHIIIKFKQTKYRKNKQIGYEKWKKYFPKATTRPSDELMNIWDVYNEIQLFNLTKVNNNHKKMILKMRYTLKFTTKTMPIHPSFVRKPTKINLLHCDAIEMNYPGCCAQNGIILYIHGGGFVWSTSEYGLPMLYQLMAKTGCIGMAINYRISPENNILDAVNDCINCHEYIINNYTTENIFIIGDSAGGALTLLTLQALNNNNKLKQVKGGIILSGVCDLSCSHQSFIENKNYDPVLHESGLKAGYQMGLSNIDINGKSTGNNIHATNPLYSPLHGSFKGLCPLYFSSGIHEILFDENVATMNKAKNEGVKVSYEWNQWLIHCTAIWVVYDIPEAAGVLCNIAVWINKLCKIKSNIN